MAFWDADFTTRMGSQSATDQAALACFLLAGFRVIATLFFGGMMGIESTEGQVVAGLTALEALVAIIAGFRFRAGKGAYWGMAVVALLALGIISALTSVAIGGIVISTIFLVIVVQGLRGAFALRNSQFSDDEIEAFE